MPIRNLKFSVLALAFISAIFFLAGNFNIAQAEGQFLFKWGTTGTENSQFGHTQGIAVDKSDNSVYVVDSFNNRIQKFTSDGTFITKWGSYGTGDGQFNVPSAVATDPRNGDVYVSEWVNNRIQKFTSDGTFITKWGSYGTGDGQFDGPRGIAVDSSGNVYVADCFNSRVQKFTSNGTYKSQWGSWGTEDGQFQYISGIAIDNSDIVYVTDHYGHRIKKFTSNGTFIAKWGSNGTEDGQFQYPVGIAVNDNGNVYVVDSYNNRIQKFTSDGTFIAKFGSPGSGDGEFNEPFGVAVNRSGNVYVTDSWNDRVEVFGSPVPVGPTKLWIGLKNGVDRGTRFDLKTELYLNGVLSSEGRTLCIVGITRNPSNAKLIEVPSNPIEGLTLNSGDVVSLKVSARIGTNSDGTKCSRRNSATGLRLYYDAEFRSSSLKAKMLSASMADYYLHYTRGSYFLNDTLPTGAVKHKDSPSVNFNNRNRWKEIGTWSMQLQ